MKLHYLKHTLVRRNLIQDTVDCFGLWVDHSIHNTRITQNIVVDSDKAAFYLEASYGPNLVDHNIFWGGNSDGIFCSTPATPPLPTTLLAAVKACPCALTWHVPLPRAGWSTWKPSGCRRRTTTAW